MHFIYELFPFNEMKVPYIYLLSEHNFMAITTCEFSFCHKSIMLFLTCSNICKLYLNYFSFPLLLYEEGTSLPTAREVIH